MAYPEAKQTKYITEKATVLVSLVFCTQIVLFSRAKIRSAFHDLCQNYTTKTPPPLVILYIMWTSFSSSLVLFMVFFLFLFLFSFLFPRYFSVRCRILYAPLPFKFLSFISFLPVFIVVLFYCRFPHFCPVFTTL